MDCSDLPKIIANNYQEMGFKPWTFNPELEVFS